MSGRDDFLNAIRPKVRRVRPAGMDIEVLLRQLTLAQQKAFGLEAGEEPDPDTIEKMVIASVCDENGQLILTEEDVPALSDSAGLIGLVKEINRINGADEAAAQDLAKNSEASQSSGLSAG